MGIVIDNVGEVSGKMDVAVDALGQVSTKVDSTAVHVSEMSGKVDIAVDGVGEVSSKVDIVTTGVEQVSKKVDTAAVNISEVSSNLKTAVNNEYLKGLPRAKYASYNCERPDRPSSCFKGTRVPILRSILDWIGDASPDSPRFFWLNGIAGIGKTTVARTIAEELDDQNLLGGNFFFSRRGEAELRNPAIVFPTIAYQLARYNPEFGRLITAALEADPEAPYASLKQQLDRLIVKPLSAVERDPARVVVVVFDAFDECEARGAKEILQLLLAAMPSLPFFLKIFVTSRPEHHITSVLVPSSGLRITALHDIEASIVKEDILLYLRARLQQLGEECGIDLPPDWFKEADVQLLADKAGKLFIHAATSVRFLLEGWDPREQLEILLRFITSAHPSARAARPFAELDQLYEQILISLLPSSDATEAAERLRLVLGSIILLRDSLPVAALERLIGLPAGRAASILRYLHSVVLTPNPPDDYPKAHHPSFPDFLQDPSRCTDGRLRINSEEHEVRIVLRCFEIMKAMLHVDMLGDLDRSLANSEVEDVEIKVNAAFPPELQYACRYWVSHLARTTSGNPAIEVAVGEFASASMVPWMEAMSWLGETRAAVTAFEDIKAWMVCTTVSSRG